MELIICFSIAVIILIVTTIICLKSNKNRLFTAGAGLFLSLFILFFPAEYSPGITGTANNVITSVVHSIKVFGLNEDFFGPVFDFGTLPEWFSIAYVLLLNLLYLIAPLLSIGIIISIFSDISFVLKLAVSVKKDVYIFSSKNARSSAIARDIKNNLPGAVTVFYQSEKIIFSRQNNNIFLNAANWLLLNCTKHLTIFLCDDENINLTNTVEIITAVKDMKKLTEKLKNNTSENTGIDLFFFSSSKSAEPIMNGIGDCGIRIRRFNECQNIIYNFIYDNPVLNYADDSNEINIVIAGFGHFGEEYLKAAIWSAQHPDYKIKINVFDIRKVSTAFEVKYPELVNTDTLKDKDEINYKINFFDETDIFETCFENIPEIRNAGIVLIALGDDEKNFDASIYLRECFERMGIKPEIHTIMSQIESSNITEIDMRNHKRQSYCIDFILPEKIYTYAKLIDSPIEKMGRKMFLMWNNGENITDSEKTDYSDFYDFEFNYRSSISASLFWQIRKNLGMNIEVSEENKHLEHQRWNAYMRSEGFRYSPKRNDVAKLHHNLVPFDDLDEATKAYDAYPIISVSKDT